MPRSVPANRPELPVPAGLAAASIALVLALGALPAFGAEPSSPAFRRADPVTEARAGEWADAHATTGWMPNLGQIAGPDGRPSRDILYAAQVPGAQVQVTRSGLSHWFLKRHPRLNPRKPGDRETEQKRPVDWARLDLRLEGADIRPERARATRPVEGQGGTNYYLAHCPDGVLNVPTYGQITFDDVYPGIDWVVRREPDGGVHHDFVVRPGADPSRVRLSYAGATAIELSDDRRALVVRTSLGEVREGALHVYQDDAARTPVDAKFRLRDGEVSVELGDYDRSAPLVIDPPLVWATYYGGSNYDGPRNIWIDDANDFVYIVGYTASTNLPALNPGGGAHYQGTFGGAQDAFIWKFNQLGVRLWATYYGGSDSESANDCTGTAAGDLYVAGNTWSSNFPTQVLPGAYNQGTSGGNADGFLLRFDSNGVRQWATHFGGTEGESIEGIVLDAANRIFVTGWTRSPDLPLSNPGGGAYFQSGIASDVDGFVARFSSGGAFQWGTFLGGDGDEIPAGITTTATDLYVSGNTQSTDFPVLNPGGGAYFQSSLGGFADGFIARFGLATGAQLWTTYFGGTDLDYADDAVVDANGNVFLYCFGNSTDVPTWNPGGTTYFQGANAGSYDFFLVKFSPTNVPIWGTYFGGSGMEYLNGAGGKPIAKDAQGRIYLTGMTSSTDHVTLDPGGGAFYDNTQAGVSDATLARFANDGTLQWSTYWGAANWDFGTSVRVSATGCLFATGESVVGGTLGTVNPGFGAWYQAANAGGDDGYILKLCAPSSACCQDFNCVAVSSASECTAIGGTAFHPNQTCAQVTCTILCGICGTKFDDQDRDGVRDNGEPGLAGWTIQLFDAGGALYATTVTDANGNYCFQNLPCGTWKVGEVQQPGWVQTFPAGLHTLSIGTGTTQNGVNFGNWSCGTTTPSCIGLPPGVAAWWPLDAVPGVDVAHGDPARNVAQRYGPTPPGTPGAWCFTSPLDRGAVPLAEQRDVNFGSGSFAIAVWFDASSSGGTGRRTIAEQRDASPFGDARGWSLHLVGLQAFLELGTGSAGSPPIAGPTVTPDAWSHLVVSVDRSTGHGRWYLNGDPMPTFDFTPPSGPITSAGDLSLGQTSPAFGVDASLEGCIADLTLFDVPLTDAQARKAWDPTPVGWCPEFAAMPAVKTFCKDDSTITYCFTLYNYTGTSKTYHWSLAGLPSGPGCTVNGPTQIVPSAGVVTVPSAGNSGPICVTIKRPAGLTAQNATACMQLTFFNTATGICRTRTAKVRADNSCWCASNVPNHVVGVAARIPAGTVIGIPIENPCDPIASVQYQIRAEWQDPDHEDPQAVRLNGLPPGEPVIGSISGGASTNGQVNVAVSYPGGHDPGARYEIVVEADTDANGEMDRLGGVLVESRYDTAAVVSAPRDVATPRSLKLVTRPNPFQGGSSIEFALAQAEHVEVGVFDLGGRLVRSLARGRLEAGAHRLPWDGRDARGRRAPAGVYFVRFTGAGGAAIEAKLVKMR